MNKTEHTQGPWNAATSASSVVGWPVVSQQGRPICDVAGVPHGFPNHEKHNAEALANARLIAAAPDMLSALEDAETSMLDSGYTPDSVTVKKIRAAIAKARGQS